MSESVPPPSQRTIIVSQKLPERAGPQLRAVLTTSSANDTAKVLMLPETGLVTIGRSAQCTFRFDDSSVSSTHARLACVNGTWVFADNNSTNGSFVNDVRVLQGVPLNEGDRIRLGPNYLLRFSMVDPDEQQALKRMYEAALVDGLTRVFNRKHLEDRLEAEVSFAIRNRSELTVIILDIDFFKSVNDTYGHQAGDAVLKTVAQVLQKGVRTEDLLARYGGEEFVVVARGINVQQGCAFAERLRMAVAGTSVEFMGKALQVTISLGVASLADCAEHPDKESILHTADTRLYQAKQGGRNRVVGWT